MGIPTKTDTREQRGFALAATAPVARFGKAWLVSSQSSTTPYKVTLKRGKPHCTCPDHTHRGVPCKHMYAAAFAALGVSARNGTAH